MHLAESGGDDLDLRMLLDHAVDHPQKGARVELGLGGHLRPGYAQSHLQVLFVTDQDVHVLDDPANHFSRARGTPRIANRLLRRIRDYAQVAKAKVIALAIAVKSLDDLGIDKAGLDDLDRKVLKVIVESYDGGPVGVESVAASLNEEVDTVIDTVEPYLLKAGFLKRTSRGRVASKQTYDHFGLKYNKEKQEEMFEK